MATSATMHCPTVELTVRRVMLLLLLLQDLQ